MKHTQTDNPTSIQYRNKDGSGAGGNCDDESVVMLWHEDKEIFASSVKEIRYAVNEYAALNAIAEAAKAVEFAVFKCDRFGSGAFLENAIQKNIILKQALSALATLRNHKGDK